MKKLQSTLPNMIGALVGICVCVSAILALLNHFTEEPIQKAQEQAKINAIRAVTPSFDNNPYEEAFHLGLAPGDSLTIYPAKQGGNIVGYAIETNTRTGFSGLIEIMMGLNTSGELIDYSVLTIAETPGLGSKIPEWFRSPSKSNESLQDVRGLNLGHEMPLKVKQDGGKVDAITAATISSRAFLDALSRGYDAYKLTQIPPNK